MEPSPGMSKNRGDGHWHPCRSWRRSWVLPSMILAAKKIRKLEWWSSEWLTLESYSFCMIMLWRRRHLQTQRHADSKQSFESLLQISQHLVNYVHHWVLLKPQDLPGYKMTGNWLPSTMPEPRGKTNPKSQSRRDDELLSYLGGSKW